MKLGRHSPGGGRSACDPGSRTPERPRHADRPLPRLIRALRGVDEIGRHEQNPVRTRRFGCAGLPYRRRGPCRRGCIQRVERESAGRRGGKQFDDPAQRRTRLLTTPHRVQRGRLADSVDEPESEPVGPQPPGRTAPRRYRVRASGSGGSAVVAWALPFRVSQLSGEPASTASVPDRCLEGKPPSDTGPTLSLYRAIPDGYRNQKASSPGAPAAPVAIQVSINTELVFDGYHFQVLLSVSHR